jgi:hypothetical protein
MWKPIDTEFFFKYRPVAIAPHGNAGDDSRFVRTLLEQLGAVVLLHQIGTPGDFLRVISQGQQAAPYLVICGHGDEDGLVFGEYAPNIDTSMLIDGKMPPKCIAEHVNLPDCVVINTACYAGREPMADAFMKGGLKAYIGSVDAPEFFLEPLFLAHFFYRLLTAHGSERQAWEHAGSYDAGSRQYAFYDKEGLHRIE